MTRLIRKKRGVSVVISTLLVLAITIVGAVSISNLMSTSALGTVNQTPKAIIAANSVILSAYDTRDGTSLFNIANFDNDFDNELCTTSCAGGNSNLKPTLGGTDFIAIELWNKNSNEVFVKSLQVNGVTHVWDISTKNQVFDPSIGIPPTGQFPKAGMFSIIPTSSSPLTQQQTQQVDGDKQVILVIKLSPDFASDLDLGIPLQILVNIGDYQPSEYVILTGDAK